MTLTTKFNNTYSFTALNDNLLSVAVIERGYNSATIVYLYDFSACMLHSRFAGSSSATPFSLLDRQSLEVYHAKLCEVGGQPPPLPPLEPQDNFSKLTSIKNDLRLP